MTPPEPRRSPADELFNSVDLSRRNRDGNEEMHRQINDEAAKLPELLRRKDVYGLETSPSSKIAAVSCSAAITSRRLRRR